MPCKAFHSNFYKKNITTPRTISALQGVINFSNECYFTVFMKLILDLVEQLFRKSYWRQMSEGGGTKRFQGGGGLVYQGWCHVVKKDSSTLPLFRKVLLRMHRETNWMGRALFNRSFMSINEFGHPKKNVQPKFVFLHLCCDSFTLLIGLLHITYCNFYRLLGTKKFYLFKYVFFSWQFFIKLLITTLTETAFENASWFILWKYRIRLKASTNTSPF